MYGTLRAVACANLILGRDGSFFEIRRKVFVEMSAILDLPRYPWFALETRHRYEEFVAKQLRGKGYEPFLPLYKERRRWSDRFKEIEVPLFSGYLFCRFNVQNRLPVLTTAGLIQIVGAGKTPIPVAEEEIAAIQTVVRSGLPSQPWPFMQIQQKARITCGPLCGLEGTLLKFKGHHRLVLSVTLLQRSIAVEVESNWVIPVSQVPGTSRSQVLSPVP